MTQYPEKQEDKIEACDNKSVGMLIWKNDQLLLIERKRFPFGFAPPAGHVDNHGSFEQAAKDEVEEEVGLKVLEIRLLTEGRKNNLCRRPGGNWHHWKIYEVKAEGGIAPSPVETKQVGWFSEEEITKLSHKTEEYLKGQISEKDWQSSPGIEPVWHEWFKKINLKRSLGKF